MQHGAELGQVAAALCKGDLRDPHKGWVPLTAKDAPLQIVFWETKLPNKSTASDQTEPIRGAVLAQKASKQASVCSIPLANTVLLKAVPSVSGLGNVWNGGNNVKGKGAKKKRKAPQKNKLLVSLQSFCSP